MPMRVSGTSPDCKDLTSASCPTTPHNGGVTARRPPWVLAGVLAGLAGLATSYATAMVLTIRESPVVAVGELVVRLTPGAAAERAISVLGHWDKPALVLGILVFLVACFALAGRLASKGWWRPLLVWFALAGIGLVAVLVQRGAGLVDTLPVLVGLVTWVTAHSALTDALQRERTPPRPRVARAARLRHGAPARSRWPRWASRSAAGSSVPVVGRWRPAAGCCASPASPGARRPPRRSVGLAGIAPWQTPNEDFYLIDTTLAKPTIDPEEWSLRIHGLVDRELVAELLRPRLAGDDGVVDHPQLRQQRGGRRPRRQRPLERRTAGGPARRPRRAPTAPTASCRPPTTAGSARRRSPR